MSVLRIVGLSSLAFGLLPSVVRAQFSKTIQVMPGVQVNAVTTWDYENCMTIGVGAYTLVVAPKQGTVTFSDVGLPIPGCTTGAQTSTVAFYTWTGTTPGVTSDYFQLDYMLNGQVAEVIDVTVTLAASTLPPAPCNITSQTLATVPGVPNSRTRVGVGESVQLTTDFSATWTIDSSSGDATLTDGLMATTFPSDIPASAGFPTEQCLVATSSGPVVGTQACFTAPYSNDTSIVTATANGVSCSRIFTTLTPQLIFQRMQSPPLDSPGYRFFDFPPIFYQIGMVSDIFLTPGDVSFANIRTSELDASKPHLNSNFNMLFTVNGTDPQGNAFSTNAWLVGCDHDINVNFLFDVLSKQSYWIFVDWNNGHNTPFSLVKTETSHSSLTGDFYFSKGQIQALSPSGSFVTTPDAPSALLTVPRLTTPIPFSKVPFPTPDQCVRDVQQQFAFIQ